MRIAMFTDSFVPEINGVAASVFTLYQELKGLGHDVHIYAPTNPEATGEARDVHRIASMPLVVLPERRVAFFSPKLLREISEIPFDIVHTHSEFMMGMLGRMVARRIGCPMVHTYHTIWEDYTYYITHGIGEERARRFARKFSRNWCNGFDTIVTPTRKTERLLRSYGVRRPIRILPTGLDIDRFAPTLHPAEQRLLKRREIGLPDHARVILSIGRISREKNLEAVIGGMPSFFKKHPEAYLVLIGSGPWVEVLKTQAAQLQISDRVLFPGPKPWQEIDAYYAIGDVFVSASLSETQGLTYIEALASGVPVVAQQDDALEEVVEPGVNGLLFQTPEEMEEALERVLYSPQGELFRTNAAPSMRKYDKTVFAHEMVKTYQFTRYRLTGDIADRPVEMPEMMEVEAFDLVE